MNAPASIKKKVETLIEEISGIPIEEIQADPNFDDLGLDSLSRIELLVDVEREFGLKAPTAENADAETESLANQVTSVDQVVQMVLDLKKQQSEI